MEKTGASRGRVAHGRKNVAAYSLPAFLLGAAGGAATTKHEARRSRTGSGRATTQTVLEFRPLLRIAGHAIIGLTVAPCSTAPSSGSHRANIKPDSLHPSLATAV